MASKSDNAAVQKLRARYRAQLDAVRLHNRRVGDVHAAEKRLADVHAALTDAQHRQRLALATLAALLGDVESTATTVGTDASTVTKFCKAVDPADVRVEVHRLLEKALPARTPFSTDEHAAEPTSAASNEGPVLDGVNV